jgi:hypothetical protein
MIPFHYISSQSLLKPKSVKVFTSEEDHHPWHARTSQTLGKPLLRISDHYSGSQLCDGCLESRAPHERLDTYVSRKNSLTIHINHKDWRPTPYISFTTLPVAVQEIAEMRRRRRGPQTLMVVDPDARVGRGLPILDVAAEMRHYEIEDPYGKGSQYYKHHYVCPWQVSREEVMGEWQWDDLVTQKKWYQDIIMPTFRQHRGETVRNPSVKELFDLSSLASALPGKKRSGTLFHRVNPNIILSDLSITRIPAISSGRSDFSSEELESHPEDEAGSGDADSGEDSDARTEGSRLRIGKSRSN